MDQLDTVRDRYFELKTRIRKSWFDMGESLREIQSRKLYRVEFDTFQAFCEQTLEITRRRAYQLIEAASIVEEIKNVNPGTHLLPGSEAAARPLVGLPAEDAAEVWKRATEATDHPTRDQVRAARAAYEMEAEEESGQDHAPSLDRFREVEIVAPPTDPDERLTPREIVDLAHFVLSGITLDPCADHTNHTDAATAWTEGGLEREWFGRVFCAPPVSQVAAWVRKAASEAKNGEVESIILFLPARPWEPWNKYIAEHPRCFLSDIPEMQPRAREGCMVVAIGGDSDTFFDNFAALGDCYLYAS